MKKIIYKIISCFPPFRNIQQQFLIKSNQKLFSLILFNDEGAEINVQEIKGLKLTIRGENICIRIHKDAIFTESEIIVNSNNVNISIGKSKCHNVLIRCLFGEGQSLTLGNQTTIWGAKIILDENSSVKIGNNCLLSDEIRIWASDGHVILDKNKKQLLNSIKHPLIIGDHCWLGQGVRLLKNTIIPNNCVIGGGAVVTKEFSEQNTIIAGNPAKIIKRGIDWDIQTPFSYQTNQLNNEIPHE